MKKLWILTLTFLLVFSVFSLVQAADDRYGDRADFDYTQEEIDAAVEAKEAGKEPVEKNYRYFVLDVGERDSIYCEKYYYDDNDNLIIENIIDHKNHRLSDTVKLTLNGNSLKKVEERQAVSVEKIPSSDCFIGVMTYDLF